MTEIDSILLCAFRYCLGRETYVVAECAGWLRNRWSIIGGPAREMILHELGEVLTDHPETLGATPYQIVWNSLYRDLSARGLTPWEHLRPQPQREVG